MNIKVSRNDDSDVAIAKRVSRMMINNYMKGLAIANQELAAEEGIPTPPTPVDPSQTIRIKKQKPTVVSVPGYSKGYKIKPVEASDLRRSVGNTGVQTAKDFVTQSKVLDNELDHLVALLKYNNKGEFYNIGGTVVTGGTIFSRKEKAHYGKKATKQEIENKMEELVNEITAKEEQGIDASDDRQNYAFLENVLKKFSTLFTKDEKRHYKNNATDEEINQKMEEILNRISSKEANQEDVADEYDNFRFLEDLMNDGKVTYADKLRALGRYDTLNDVDKRYGEQLIRINKTKFKDKDNEKMAQAMRDLGYDVDRHRSKAAGKTQHLNKITGDDLVNTYTGKNAHLKSKKGIRITDTTDVEKFSQEVLLGVKKVSNHITTILMPLATKLYDQRFRGTTLHDKTVVIPELYEDMDDKMYIVTSLNNQSNTQLIKLDKDFDKLYNMVKNGLDMYVMETAGSMNPLDVLRRTTDYPREL